MVPSRVGDNRGLATLLLMFLLVFALVVPSLSVASSAESGLGNLYIVSAGLTKPQAPPPYSQQVAAPTVATSGLASLAREAQNDASPTWSNLTGPVEPPPLDYSTLAYDPTDNYTVLFGGQAAGAYPTNQTWILTNGSWTNITSSAGQAPIPRDGMAMSYDPVDHYIVAYGGGGFSNACTETGAAACNSTWAFYSGKWHLLSTSGAPPEVSMQFGMAYDAADGYVLATNGFQTWKYLSGAWAPFCGLNCSSFIVGPNLIGSVAYDAHDGYVLFFGENYTWKFHAGAWTNITTQSGGPPSSRQYPMLASDSNDGSVALFGGILVRPDDTYVLQNDTWIFQNGTWTNVSSEVAPNARYAGGFSYNGQEDNFVLFGGDTQLGSAGNLNDTWIWGVYPPISQLRLSVTPATPVPGAETNFSVNFTGGNPPFSYLWDFGDGNSSALSAPSHVYGSVGFFRVSLRVNDSQGYVSSASIQVHVYISLSVTSILANPDPAILDRPVNF